MGLFSPSKKHNRETPKKSASNPNLNTQSPSTSGIAKNRVIDKIIHNKTLERNASEITTDDLQKNLNMQPAKNSDEGEGVQTSQSGMDRYITIKRKRTKSDITLKDSRESKLIKNDKQKEFTIETQNRFDTLVEQGETSDKPIDAREEKPPPIYVREMLTKVLIEQIKNECANDFHVCPIKKGNIHETKIQINSVAAYRKVVMLLDKENKNYYTYQLKSSKGLSVVLKGIEPSIAIDELKEDLNEKGFRVKNIINIKNKNNEPQPMFKVELEPETAKIKGKHPIYDLRYVLYRKIVVEEPRKRKSLIQCFNCQEFGHTHNYCKLSEVCVICAGSHKTNTCPHDKNVSTVKKCSNCGENHTANYRGCSIYIELKKRLIPKQRAEQRFLNKESKPEAKHEAYVPSFVQPGQSYASFFTPSNKKKDDASASVETMINTLNSTMLKFMQMMENNMSLMLQCMNTLMQQNSK